MFKVWIFGSIHAGGHALQITRYTCILDVTLDPPNAWIIYLSKL
jgi:hypothetical protein